MRKVKLRKIQGSVINAVRQAIKDGKTEIFISAPTGTGKGLIALELARDFDSYILTSEKTLQTQYEEDTQKYDVHTDAKSICGIDTYRCHVNDEKFSLGVCRMMGKSNREALKMECSNKCEYLQRWLAAQKSSRCIMNYSYWLIQMNLVLAKMEEAAPFNVRDLVICDEAHKLPDIIEDHFACSIDKKFVERIRNLIMMLRSTGNIDHAIAYEGVDRAIISALMVDPKEKPESHLNLLKVLLNEYALLRNAVDDQKDKFASRYLRGSTKPEHMRKKLNNMPKEVRATFRLGDSLKDRMCKLSDYITIIEESSLNNLIVDPVSGEERRYHTLDDSYLFHKHFSQYSKIRIYLSATLQPDLLIRRFGIKSEDALVLDVASSWDKRRSPIVLCNTANMTYKNQDESLRLCIRKIDSLLKEHPNQRGLIHTTSNMIMNEIKENSRFADRIVTYSGTDEKMDILNNFGNYPEDAVLVGPSLTTGIDMKDSLARFNIVVKLSFPNMGSALWAKRFEAANHIYIGETASVLEQSCGRTTRSAEDFSISYILDSRAQSFIFGNKQLFSTSFLERIVT